MDDFVPVIMMNEERMSNSETQKSTKGAVNFPQTTNKNANSNVKPTNTSVIPPNLNKNETFSLIY